MDKDENYTPNIAEIIGEMYKGSSIQIYLGESGGNTHYADFDIEQKVFMEGVVLWSKGNVLALECYVETGDKKYNQTVLINAWSITSVMEKQKNGVDISMIMKGMRKR